MEFIQDSAEPSDTDHQQLIIKLLTLDGVLTVNSLPVWDQRDNSNSWREHLTEYKQIILII